MDRRKIKFSKIIHKNNNTSISFFGEPIVSVLYPTTRERDIKFLWIVFIKKFVTKDLLLF